MNRDQRIRIASFVFFLSGCSALVFETIWFRVTSTVLGSSVWSAAAVLMAFMSGLALGNAFMMVRGQRVARVFRFYVVVEVTIGVSGVAAVVLLPKIGPLVSQMLAQLSEQQSVLNVMRFAVAFCVLLVPAIAMGTTLPVLLKGLHGLDRSFSAALGRLYGWNTIGAVAGVVVAEFVLVGFLGITHTAFFAALLNLCAALLIVKYFRIDESHLERPPAAQPVFLQRGLSFLLLAPFAIGLVLLALEVIWFRYLLLMHEGTSTVFATMLAVVLAGIGIGGLVATRINTDGRRLDVLLTAFLAAGTLCVVASFYLCNFIYTVWFYPVTQKLHIFLLAAVALMLPNSVISGLLFPLLGEKLHRALAVTTRTSGILTLANTSGAAIGSGIATFVLLPALGIEKSLLLLCYGYMIAAMLLLSSGQLDIAPKRLLSGLVLIAVLVLGIFPYQTLKRAYETFSSHMLPGEKLIFVKEGLNETLQYYRFDVLDHPLTYRLVTNGFSMSGTTFNAKRYMKFFVYYPFVVRPEIKDVLLISYGVGNTAEAIASLPQVRRYDVVDISRDVLTFSEIIHGQTDRHPLKDPRAHVHIEDGRFFLQTTERRFDLITGEPPPPKHAGVVNLYTQEYFQLMRNRLNTGGMVTYWLPGHALGEADTLAITKAFCLTFEDCSLWAPAGLDFVLVGTRGGLAKISATALHTAWQSTLANQLAAIGYEAPTQLLTSFVADATILAQLTDGIAPVIDDFPNRIAPDAHEVQRFSRLYAHLLDDQRRVDALRSSDYISALFPPETIQAAVDQFRYEKMYTALLTPGYMGFNFPYWERLIDVLENTDLTVLPALSLGATPEELAIADSFTHESNDDELLRAKSLIVRRRYRESAQMLRHQEQVTDAPPVDSNSVPRLALLATGLVAAASGSWSEYESLATSFKTENAFAEGLRDLIARRHTQ